MSTKEIKIDNGDGKVIVVDMRGYILTVASSLMTKKGIKETSLKDIAKEAGISKGTLYYYYSAKEDIIYDIAESNLSEITDELLHFVKESSGNVDVKEILKTLFEKILASDTRGRLHLYLLNDVSTNEALKEKFFKMYASWRKVLAESLDRILPQQGNNQSLATVILALIDGLQIQKFCGCDDASVDDIINILVP